MAAWLELKAWPELPPALRELKGRGLRLAFLSDATPVMLDSWVENSALRGVFDAHLSTDRVRAFKPDPRAYQMGTTGNRHELTRAPEIHSHPTQVGRCCSLS
jgi:2-haloacid dehalogenase